MTRSTRREFCCSALAGSAAVCGVGSLGDALASPNEKAPVDASTLQGKVMAGYQGWFRCPGDGSGQRWQHYARGETFDAQSCTIDFWPDVSELSAEERYRTGLRHEDGSPAEVFSSHNRRTVLRHFQWMRDYGLDGVFVQRFATSVTRKGQRGRRKRRSIDHVLESCRSGARRFGRTFAVMYDLSGMDRGTLHRVKEDWRHLNRSMRITGGGDSRYLHHRERPVVAIWGIGFSGPNRRYGFEECRDLIDFFKGDPEVGGVTLMLGIPTGWRNRTGPTTDHPALHETLARADLLSPWTVGRYRKPPQIDRHAEEHLEPDLRWCSDRGVAYLPVVFPGFSWRNLKGRSDYIPRLGGQFLWRQYAILRQMQAPMVYQAMFDEMDEGTQIFKVTNQPPQGEAEFRTYNGLASDHYLWLVGEARRMIQRQAPHRRDVPLRPGHEARQRELAEL